MYKINTQAWNRAQGAWIRACELARSYNALPGETPLTVAWWLFERDFPCYVLRKKIREAQEVTR